MRIALVASIAVLLALPLSAQDAPDPEEPVPSEGEEEVVDDDPGEDPFEGLQYSGASQYPQGGGTGLTYGNFGFTSYGRVGFIFDDDIETGNAFNVVRNGQRWEEAPYQELGFYYRDVIEGLPIFFKTTLAFRQDLFHFNGDFDIDAALRELYIEVYPHPDVAIWVGERLYRGDDIYLFDFWPLDELNTLGGGVSWTFLEKNRLQFHIGANRLEDESFFQFQQVEVPNEDEPGTNEQVFLDRNRIILSATYTRQLPWNLQTKVHLEYTHLPSGDRQLENGTLQELPRENGLRVGGQLKWNWGDGSFTNLFVTYGLGLGAYDELEIPFGFDQELSIEDSEFVLVGVGGAWNTDYFAAHYGSYFRTFEDSDGVDDADDVDEFIVAVRPEVYLGAYMRLGLEVSYQWSAPGGVFAETGSEENPQVYAITPFVAVNAGKGAFARPQLRAFVGFRGLSDAAQISLSRNRREELDSEELVFGLSAEWWF